jgi:hypothetical protein
MLTKRAQRTVVVLLLPFVLAGTSLLAGPSLQNGDFSSPLSVGWTDWDLVTIDAGVAVLGEDPVVWAFLEQEFMIPTLALSLSFEYKPLFEADGAETFTASLLDPVSYDPLIPTDADPLDPSETYYFMHDWNDFWGINDVITDPAYVTLTDLGAGWTSVTLDLTSLGGIETEALLAFDFIPGFDDLSLDGEIRIDNVGLQVIPVPSAIVLGLIGLGALGAISRRCEQLLS